MKNSKKESTLLVITIIVGLGFVAGICYYAVLTINGIPPLPTPNPKSGVAAYIPQQVTHSPLSNKETESSTSVSNTKNKSVISIKPKSIPKTLTIKGQVISYENTGVDTAQSFIDAHPDFAGTYYGSSFSGTDNRPTHFAGHDFGKFGIIKQLVVGDTVTVTNEAGEEFKYVVTETRSLTVIYKDHSGYTQNQDDANFILNMMNSQSEGIFLQTCASEVENGTFDVFFVVAKPA